MSFFFLFSLFFFFLFFFFEWFAGGSAAADLSSLAALRERKKRERERKGKTRTFLLTSSPPPPPPQKQCGNKCPGSDDPTKNIGCCGGKCYDLNGDGGPTLACGRCGQPCQTSNGAASCTGGTCSLACNAGYSSCNATSLTNVLNLNVPICVDTTVNPLFCGGCNSRCPFDRYGATTCGQFGDGVNATAASCKVTCSPSYPTQCGTISNYNASSATRPPTSNCANTNQDVNNCGGVRRRRRFFYF
jgi:hypothetical protein